jgi:hypothetical protein
MNERRRGWLRSIALGVFYLAALAYYAGLLQSNSRRIHEPRTFGDSGVYLDIARLPVFSAAFWTDIKPGAVPLIYKMLGYDPERIFVFQLWSSVAAWGILALAVACALRSYWLRPIAFVLVLAFSLGRDVFMWIPFIGSEAISFSALALFLAAALWLISDWKGFKIPLLIAAAFLMAFSRDTWTYVILLAAAVLIPLLWLSSHRRQLLIIIVSFLVIFAAGALTARAGLRNSIVFDIVMAMRVLPNPEYLAFFRGLGAPIDPSLVERSNPNLPGYGKWEVYLAMRMDPAQEAYRRWARAHATGSFLRFLWFYKVDAFQGMFTDEAGRAVFAPDVYYYTATGYRPILKDPRLAEFLYPTRFAMLFFFLVQIAAAFACGFAIMLRKRLWLVPIVMILATYPQAFLVWNADPNDLHRHSVGHNIMERLGFWILLLFVIDLLAESLRPAVDRMWKRARSRQADEAPAEGGASG